MRFHWNHKFRIVFGHSDLNQVAQENARMEKHFVNLILSSLLKSVNLVTLDIRGNGFLRDDVICLIKLLETNKHLQELNGIPVVATSALETSQVLFQLRISQNWLRT